MHGLQHGTGRYTWKDGSHYEGDWEEGIMKVGIPKIKFKISGVVGFTVHARPLARRAPRIRHPDFERSCPSY